MEKDLVKRMVKKDGSQRISFYRDEYAENPRYNTDEPLHCEDWSRGYSIMTKQDKESKSSSARSLLEYMIRNYGDYKKIIDTLVDNGHKIGNDKVSCGTALVYDKYRKTWLLLGNTNCYFGNEIENGWYEYNVLDGKKYDLDIYAITEDATDDAIDYLATNCMTDKVKMMSYGFGYDGSISFCHEVSTDSEGICWLEKDEFLKYAGGDNSEWVKKEEQVWKEKTLDEIEFLIEELKAWCDNDVYGFVVEDCIKSKIHKEYTNVDKEDEDYEEEEWEESDSCWGYYGDIDKVEGWIFEEYGLNKEDFEEENV